MSAAGSLVAQHQSDDSVTGFRLLTTLWSLSSAGLNPHLKDVLVAFKGASMLELNSKIRNY